MLQRGLVVGPRGRPQRFALVGAALRDPLLRVGLEVGGLRRGARLLGASLWGRPLVGLDQLALLVEPALGVDLRLESRRRDVSQEVGAGVDGLVAAGRELADRAELAAFAAHRSLRSLLHDVRLSCNKRGLWCNLLAWCGPPVPG